MFALKYNFHPSNNELEYEALLAGVCIALRMNVDQLIIHGDSQIVHKHITGMFEVKENNIKNYSERAKELLSQFKSTDFEKVTRRNNPESRSAIQGFSWGPQPRGMARTLSQEEHRQRTLMCNPRKQLDYPNQGLHPERLIAR